MENSRIKLKTFNSDFPITDALIESQYLHLDRKEAIVEIGNFMRLPPSQAENRKKLEERLMHHFLSKNEIAEHEQVVSTFFMGGKMEVLRVRTYLIAPWAKTNGGRGIIIGDYLLLVINGKKITREKTGKSEQFILDNFESAFGTGGEMNVHMMSWQDRITFVASSYFSVLPQGSLTKVVEQLKLRCPPANIDKRPPELLCDKWISYLKANQNKEIKYLKRLDKFLEEQLYKEEFHGEPELNLYDLEVHNEAIEIFEASAKVA